jgi:hypothetical protein
MWSVEAQQSDALPDLSRARCSGIFVTESITVKYRQAKEFGHRIDARPILSDFGVISFSSSLFM